MTNTYIKILRFINAFDLDVAAPAVKYIQEIPELTIEKG